MSNPALKPDQKYSYTDYKTWDDDERWEIIDGVVFNISPAPRRYHQTISGEVVRQISNYLKGKPCQVYAAPFDFRFIENDKQTDKEIDTVLQPDIVVVCDENKLDVKILGNLVIDVNEVF